MAAYQFNRRTYHQATYRLTALSIILAAECCRAVVILCRVLVVHIALVLAVCVQDAGILGEVMVYSPASHLN